jgi:DNA repair exonuclease SbcCD ATPase subunit
MIRIKDKELANQNQMIANLKKDNNTLRNRIDTEVGLEKLMKYENSLKEAEKRNQELLREIKALQRIQTEQGKALEKMTTDNDYVAKVKALMDELRLAKEKIKEMDEKMKKDEKTMKSQFEHMMKLQEKCKELKAQALGQPPSGGSSLGAPGVKLKGGLASPPLNADEKEKMIFELTDKLTQAEKNKEIMQ